MPLLIKCVCVHIHIHTCLPQHTLEVEAQLLWIYSFLPQYYPQIRIEHRRSGQQVNLPAGPSYQPRAGGTLGTSGNVKNLCLALLI